LAKNFDKEYLKYLKKVCKNRELRSYALDFFHDLKSLYKNRTFTRKDFETLRINGVETEQDVVKTVFQDKDKVAIDELFYNIFKANVKSLSFFTFSWIYENDTTGYYSHKYRAVRIKRQRLDIPKAVASSETNPTKENKQKEKERLAKLKKAAQAERSESLKHIVYHELGHVLDTKTFADGKYFKHNLTDQVLIYHGKKVYPIDCDEITETSLQEAIDFSNYQKDHDHVTSDGVLRLGKNNGLNNISEVLNEEFACFTDKSFSLSSTPIFDNKKSKFIKRAHLQGSSAYNKNYDIVKLLEIILDSTDKKSLKLNSDPIKNSINGLKISKSTIKKIKDTYSNLFLSSLGSMKPKALEDFDEKLDKLDIYSTIGTILRAANIIYNYKNNDSLTQSNDDYKILIQGLLLEGIKNKISAELKNKDIVKDEKYYSKINEHLHTIDNFILYPQGEDIFLKANPSSLAYPDKVIVNHLTCYSVKKYAKEYPRLFHLQQFDELVKNVRQSLCGKEYIVDGMSFFQKQKSLDSAYSTHIREQHFAIALRNQSSLYKQNSQEDTQTQTSSVSRLKERVRSKKQVSDISNNNSEMEQ